MRALVVLACLTGCGRISFDAPRDGRGSDSDSGGGDGPAQDQPLDHVDYIKPSDPAMGANFGSEVALSADGSTLAVGAFDYAGVGVVYVFERSGDTWMQQQKIMANNADAGDQFGITVSLSGDGDTLAIGAAQEDSDNVATGNSNSSSDSGAVYVYTRAGTVWTLQQYLKASNIGPGDLFGLEVAISSDGTTLAVAAPYEDSSQSGVGVTGTNELAMNSGAVYTFTRSGNTWTQQAYFKPKFSATDEHFGNDVSLSATGDLLAVGVPDDASSSGTTYDTSSPGAGAIYTFVRAGTVWSLEAYVKASDIHAGASLGFSLAVSGDGAVLAAALPIENAAKGAVQVFAHDNIDWDPMPLLAESMGATSNDQLGHDVVMSSDGTCIVAMALGEDGSGRGYDPPIDENANGSGAAYLFRSSGGWHQAAYLKPTNTRAGLAIDNAAISADCSTIAIASFLEDSGSSGINGNSDDTSLPGAGAVYVFR